ncbi:ABC transporter permease [Alkalibacillus salilacus]|uniref:ABC-2 type transport system permease protein n=1 Tax=Alkalibacillus salilacus TaxID=284582 RepID=A0ABT9VB74_9BACI|nr:ABC transporter permease [Alkalibacillus salilacus]MDQ0158201.1 ABC-2 type transport system permease protein [Alkalibacillus salilacus]
MKPIFLAQLAKDRRNPFLIILLVVVSIVATVLFTSGTQAPMTIQIYSEADQAEAIEDKWADLLSEGTDMTFEVTEADQVKENIKQGQSEVAVKLLEDDYKLVTASNTPTIYYVEQHVRAVFEREARIEAAVSDADQQGEMREAIQTELNDPLMTMDVQSTSGEPLTNYDMGIQLMFAFTLLVAMFIIGFRVNNVLKDKVYHIWNRVILSPVSKTKMYAGYLLYAFTIGFVQTAVVLVIFNYVLDYDLGERFGLVLLVLAVFTFSMVSVAMLFTGFVKGPEQFYALYPSIIPLIPLISGAYMMPGTISNPALVFIGDLFPLSHAMDALVDLAIYDATFQEIVQPIMLMILISVISMGIGINLVERRSS